MNITQRQHGFSQPTGCPADAVGWRNRPGHTEVRVTTPRGPRIGESHNRVGGFGLNELVQTAYGVGARFDMVEPPAASPEPPGGVALSPRRDRPATSM